MKLSKLFGWDVVMIITAIALICIVLSMVSCVAMIEELEKSLDPNALTANEKAELEDIISEMREEATNPDRKLWGMRGFAPLATVADDQKRAFIAQDLDTLIALVRAFAMRDFDRVNQEYAAKRFFNLDKDDHVIIALWEDRVKGIVVMTGPHKGKMGYAMSSMIRAVKEQGRAKVIKIDQEMIDQIKQRF